ncbi:DUF805 domain-containing protein [Xanthobacter autotrophicus DSM 431]|uniref:DUF805 domain-containing protein n=1 Tax=Xanthobacter nonsaccharivorans TaxID=3119912 RepID=UPI003726C8C5
MTFTAAVRSCLSQYATFTGRAPRSEFWWFWVFTLVVEVAAVFLGGLLFAGSVREVAMGPGMSSMHGFYVYAFPNWLSGVVHLALILPSLAVAVRRLHDVGRSGWWLLIAFIPLGVFVLLFWWVQPSQREPNAHGLPPLLPAR